MSKKILIVGGVAGGASFAARMRRLDETAEIILFEKGPYISFANCGLPYHIGETIPDRDKLIVQTPKDFSARFNVDVRIETMVESVDADKKEIGVTAGGKTYRESYDFLLLSPGATPLRPPIPGIDSPRIHTLRTIPDMDRIKAPVDAEEAKTAVVIGGGFIGLETAENLRHRGLDVTMVELSDQVFMPADREIAHSLHEHLTLNGVELILEDGAKKFEDHKDTTNVVLQSGKTLTADIIILAIGVRPDTAFLENSSIERNPRGALVVNEHMQTNYPDIFAVGDAVEVRDFISKRPVSIPLAGPANRQGRIAADTIAGIPSSYKDTQGTSICKIFDLTAAVTGLNEKNARAWDIAYSKTYTHSANHASYYPDAFQMSVKMLFSPENGRVLGAQIIGKEGVDKRIDVLATAIRHGLTVYDLTELELAYAPPYGSAKDPVNMAGFVAQNALEGRSDLIYAEELAQTDPEKTILLDVRTPEEFEMGSIDNAVLIPLDELRDRVDELDKNKDVVVFCQVGLRGHVALRILVQNGFNAKNLAGGYKTWSWYFRQDQGASYLQAQTQSSCSSPERAPVADTITASIDACGLQCPGPVMQLKKEFQNISEGQVVEITATDAGFATDVPAWCARTGNTLRSLTHEKGKFTAQIQKGSSGKQSTQPSSLSSKKTMVIFSNDFDRLMASFIIANGAVSMGNDVTLFFTFWGLNLLRKDRRQRVQKSIMEKMFGMMMPRGAGKTSLSKMNMGGLGTILMKREMKKKNVYSLEDLIDKAREGGVKLVACTMSMDIMGIKKEELIDGIEYGGVAAYLNEADDAGFNLFI
jgi:NADPH-dependent 2,4-dienoyl-CoA reductase/sulfur reductase-like enzyme/peroxiredoxin family protein/rhodanese-related sulfurtransferase/TusA-related sulfurtransferase